MANSEIVRKLQQLRSHYREHLPSRVWEIRELWETWMLGQERTGVIENLYHQLHSLAGSAETFGLPLVSAAARRCLNELRPALVHPELPLSVVARQICEDSLEDISDALWQSQPNGELTPATATASKPERKIILAAQPGDSVLVKLADHMHQQGYLLQRSHNVDIDPQSAEDGTILLLDLNLLVPGSEQWFRQRWANHTVAALADQDNLEARVRASRAGVSALFFRPFDIADIGLWLDNYSGRCNHNGGRVLILADEETTVPSLQADLDQQGFRTRFVRSPASLLQATVTEHPDLIIIDHPSPELSNRDLVAAIRLDPKTTMLPILVIATDDDDDVPEPGQWDFLLARSVSRDNLMSTLQQLVGRGCLLRSLMTRDSLTQLLNHAECQRQLKLALLGAQRHGHNLSVAMIDIDHFKKVNDRYGHAMGDSVLKNTARLITQTLRRTDIVGRYGGEEFLVVLPNTDLDDAHNRVEQLRTRYAKFNHGADGDPLRATMSIGLAHFPTRHSSQMILRAADRALYRSKEDGRNRTTLDNAMLS